MFLYDYKKNGGGILGDSQPSWLDEFDMEMLTPPALGVASYVSFIECAFLPKQSKTLLVTDSVVYVSENIPDAVLERDLMESGDDNNFTINALKILNLFNIREKAKSRVNDSASMTIEEKRRLGWLMNASGLYILVQTTSWIRKSGKTSLTRLWRRGGDAGV